MKFLLTRTVEEYLELLPQQIKKRIAFKMRFYETQSDPLQFAEPLTGGQSNRFRISGYRVIFKSPAQHRIGARDTAEGQSVSIRVEIGARRVV
jgi:mRNA-degrading endonuclease RelE of RelBE toxin-antitoxin system